MSFGAGCYAAMGEIERSREWMERALLVDPKSGGSGAMKGQMLDPVVRIIKMSRLN